MADKKRTELEQRLEKLAEEQRQAEQALAQLRRDEAKEVHASVSTTLNEYVEHFTTAQRNKLIKILDGGATTAKKSSGTGRKIPMKYEVNGIQWSGRGHIPKSFKEWEKTAEGKAFRKKNPNPREFPLIKDKKNT